MQRSGSFSNSCGNCNVTWSHAEETPYSTTYIVGYHSSHVSSISALFTPRWDDLYLTCSGCDAGLGTTVVPGQLALSKFIKPSCHVPVESFSSSDCGKQTRY